VLALAPPPLAEGLELDELLQALTARIPAAAIARTDALRLTLIMMNTSFD
jgi:hypothetical protein